MSLIPVFELGLWNAWIFVIPSLLVTLLCMHADNGETATIYYEYKRLYH